MIDINGDGLPDKNYLKAAATYYRPNLGISTRSFGEKRSPLPVLPILTREFEKIAQVVCR